MKRNPQQEIASAYYQGLNGIRSMGMEPDMAEDLGIPTNREAAASDVASGKLVRSLLEKSGQLSRQTGSIICGNCCDVAPCLHIDIDSKGRGHSRD